MEGYSEIGEDVLIGDNGSILFVDVFDFGVLEKSWVVMEEEVGYGLVEWEWVDDGVGIWWVVIE